MYSYTKCLCSPSPQYPTILTRLGWRRRLRFEISNTKSLPPVFLSSCLTATTYLDMITTRQTYTMFFSLTFSQQQRERQVYLSASLKSPSEYFSEPSFTQQTFLTEVLGGSGDFAEGERLTRAIFGFFCISAIFEWIRMAVTCCKQPITDSST